MSYLSKQKAYAAVKVEEYLRAESGTTHKTKHDVERIVAKVLDKDMELPYDKAFVQEIAKEIIRGLKKWHPTRGGHVIDWLSQLEWKED